MPRGTPDGKIEDLKFAGQASDLASVSNNLWGFSSISGQGRVNYFDTFNNGLNGWQKFNTGAGSAVPNLQSSGPPPETIFSPPYCVKFNPGVTSGSRSNLGRRQFLGTSPRLGLEAAVLFNNTCPNYRLNLDYNVIGGAATGYYAIIRWSNAAGAWQAYNGQTAAYQTFYAPGVIGAGVSLWMQIKMVCDFVTGYYVRAFIGDSVFDLSAIPMLNPALYTATYKGYLYMEAAAESYGAASQPGYIGYILNTKDEP